MKAGILPADRAVTLAETPRGVSAPRIQVWYPLRIANGQAFIYPDITP